MTNTDEMIIEKCSAMRNFCNICVNRVSCF